MRTLKISELEGKRIEYTDHMEGYGEMSFVADVFRIAQGFIVVLDGDHNEIAIYPSQVVGIVELVRVD